MEKLYVLNIEPTCLKNTSCLENVSLPESLTCRQGSRVKESEDVSADDVSEL